MSRAPTWLKHFHSRRATLIPTRTGGSILSQKTNLNDSIYAVFRNLVRDGKPNATEASQ